MAENGRFVSQVISGIYLRSIFKKKSCSLLIAATVDVLPRGSGDFGHDLWEYLMRIDEIFRLFGEKH